MILISIKFILCFTFRVCPFVERNTHTKNLALSFCWNDYTEQKNGKKRRKKRISLVINLLFLRQSRLGTRHWLFCCYYYYFITLSLSDKISIFPLKFYGRPKTKRKIPKKKTIEIFNWLFPIGVFWEHIYLLVKGTTCQNMTLVAL